MDELQAREDLIEGNAREYGPLYSYMNWITPERAREAQDTRAALLLSPGVQVSCLGTKIHHGPLSPGCQQCVAGAWSCLFISGRCNGRCFYCPTPQNMDDPPMSASVPFPRAGDYAAYVRLFDFGGASISGGEPFLDFERSLEYVAALRRACGPRLHIWLYTNGILVTEEKLRRLADAGLDEIRFDIGATEFDLRFARLARGIVPTVTVEIPAVPEEGLRLQTLLPELTEAGVTHLNLHQLRLTPHNARNLLERDYTFLHGPKVTVLESELCALELVALAAGQGLPLSVNYCSFAYKNRFQAAASRRRFGAGLLESGEALSPNGHIRTVQVQDAPGADWRNISWPDVPPGQTSLRVSYAAAFLRPACNPQFQHRTVELPEAFSVVLERHPVTPWISTDARKIASTMQAPPPDQALPGCFQPSLEESCEWITPGLGLYF